MNKLLFVLGLLFVSNSVAMSQEYSELDIIGKWDVSETYGEYKETYNSYGSVAKCPINNILYFEFYDNSSAFEDSYYESERFYYGSIRIKYATYNSDMPIVHCFVANGNILHIRGLYAYGKSNIKNFRFKIVSLSGSRMELSTLDNSLIFVLTKASQSSSLNASQMNEDSVSATYNLMGVKEDNPQRGIHIYKGEKGSPQKVIVTK